MDDTVNRLSLERQTHILSLLMSGVSIRAAARVTGASTGSIQRLGLEVGETCAAYQRGVFVRLPCQRIQCDEIFSVVASVSRAAWTWTAICTDTRLVFAWLVGDRTLRSARPFMYDVRDRTEGRIHLTTDQLSCYPRAVADAFGRQVDYGAIGFTEDGKPEARSIIGSPRPELIHNNYVERQNRTMRETMCRFTRRTSGYSKSRKHHEAALGLYFMYYNFCRAHMTLTKARPNHYPTTPAMAAGLTDHVWGLADLAWLSDKTVANIGAPLRWQIAGVIGHAPMTVVFERGKQAREILRIIA